MRRENGFTLLEVLIIVVIAVSVAAFAVPAYKKTQEKNKYLAAQGVLLDLGTAVRALRADLRAEKENAKFPSLPTVMEVAHQTSEDTSLSQELQDQDDAMLCRSLFFRRYMQPIAYDSGNTYKGFSFVLCPDGTSSKLMCCNSNSAVVACMYNNSLGASSSTAGQYWGAAFMNNGSLTRLPSLGK